MRAYKTLDFELNYYEFDDVDEMVKKVNVALDSIDGLDWEPHYDCFPDYEDCTSETMAVYYTVNIHDDSEVVAVLDALNFLPKTYLNQASNKMVDRFTVQYGFVKSVDEYLEGV